MMLVSYDARVGIIAKLKLYQIQSNTMFDGAIDLIDGKIELSQQNIMDLKKELTIAAKNIDSTRSVLSRLENIEKQTRCLEEFGRGEDSKKEEADE